VYEAFLCLLIIIAANKKKPATWAITGCTNNVKSNLIIVIFQYTHTILKKNTKFFVEPILVKQN